MNNEIFLIDKLMEAMVLWTDAYQDIKNGTKLIGDAIYQPFFIEYISDKVSAFSNEENYSYPYALLIWFNLPDGMYHLSVLVTPPNGHYVNMIEFNVAICTCIEMFCYVYDNNLSVGTDVLFEFVEDNLLVAYNFFDSEFSIMFGKN